MRNSNGRGSFTPRDLFLVADIIFLVSYFLATHVIFLFSDWSVIFSPKRYPLDQYFSHYVICLFSDWSVFILFIAAVDISYKNHWDYILNTEALLGDSYDHSVGNRVPPH